MADRYLDEVVEETGISERNVKYWSQKFDIPVDKDGRRNVYPDRIVTLLKLVEALSETELFTHRFIQLQVDRALGKDRSDMEYLQRYENVRDRARKLLEVINSSLGTRVLPPLEAKDKGTRRKQKQSSSRTDSDLPDELL